MMKLLTIDELLDFYSKAETVDQEVFADQRSNLLLVSGDHYNKKSSRFWNNVRDNRDLSPEQKLRLTQNHIQKITKTYVNYIVSYSPSVIAAPNNESESQDVKAAQMHNSVIQYAKARLRFKDKVLQICEDFVNIGEVAIKLFWDETAGEVIGEEPEVGVDGQVVVDENGQPKMRAKFSGDIVHERVFGFNLLRSSHAQEMLDGRNPICIRKMVDIKSLKQKVGGDAEKLSMITQTEDKTYKVFDANAGGYGESSKDQCLLMEFYFPKSVECPNGYFYFATQAGILWHGELPFGIWPIIYTGFDGIQTSPRHRSLIKHLRPYQAEINRASSKMAEHQITTGDTKILVPSGSKVSSGATIPGVRTITYNGAKPEYLQGEVGSQYLPYIQAKTDEMYRVANLEAEMLEKEPQGDLLQNLFRSLKQRKKFTIYSDKIESFLVNYWETYLELAKAYFPDEMLVPMIGASEFVNIPEFRNTEKLCYQIKVEPQSEDVESQMGKQIVFNNLIQYIGKDLPKDAIGELIRAMPLGAWKKGLSSMTLNADRIENIILQLDRGKVPLPNKYDDAPYIIQRLSARTLQADFDQLHDQIKKNYDTMINFYEKMEAAKQAEIAAAQKGFIPSGGARVKVDYYVPKVGDPAKVERATLPAEAVDWLIKQLATQGSSQEQLQQVNTGAVAEIAGLFNDQQQSLPGSGDIYGQASPGGYQ